MRSATRCTGPSHTWWSTPAARACARSCSSSGTSSRSASHPRASPSRAGRRAKGADVDTVNVALGDRSYPIHIGSGLLQRAELVRAHLAQPRVAIVTNDVVGPLYLDALGGALERAGVQALRVTLPDGEARKNWESLNRILDALLE